MKSPTDIDGITFRSNTLKSNWKVLLSGHVIGYVAKPWCHLPYHRLLPDGSWSEKTYKNRMEAAKDILIDISTPKGRTILS